MKASTIGQSNKYYSFQQELLKHAPVSLAKPVNLGPAAVTDHHYVVVVKLASEKRIHPLEELVVLVIFTPHQVQVVLNGDTLN